MRDTANIYGNNLGNAPAVGNAVFGNNPINNQFGGNNVFGGNNNALNPQLSGANNYGTNFGNNQMNAPLNSNNMPLNNNMQVGGFGSNFGSNYGFNPSNVGPMGSFNLGMVSTTKPVPKGNNFIDPCTLNPCLNQGVSNKYWNAFGGKNVNFVFF